MIDMGIRFGSEAQAVPVLVDIDTVYVRTDIQEVPPPDGVESEESKVFQYHEYQYTKDEYINLLGDQNEELNDLVNTILGVT